MLGSYGYSLPTYQKLNPVLLQSMKEGGVGTIDLFFEYLDLLHLQDGQKRQALADMLRLKYSALGIDLVVALHSPAMSFLRDEAAEVFPKTPLLFWNLQESFHVVETGQRIFRTLIGIDVAGTLDLALDVFPNTERVVVISGVSHMDKLVETEARRALTNGERKLEAEYLTDSSVDEILARVAVLPPRSIVLYCNIFQDKTGRTYTPSDVGSRIAKTANAPVFCLYDTHLGSGMVGGSLLSFETEGRRIARIALGILNGTISSGEEAAAIIGKPVPMFDWQQIQRWGGEADNLSKGTIFLNRPFSLWSVYRYHIIAFLFILLVQLLLIGTLLLERRQRKRAEKELRISNATLEQRVAERTERLRELAYFPEENPYPVLRCTLDAGIMYTNMPAKQWLATFDRPATAASPLPDPVREAVAEAGRFERAVQVEITNPAGCTFGITAVQPPGEAYVNLYAIDLTVRISAQQALERSNQELERQLRKIEELNRNLQMSNSLLEEKQQEAKTARNQLLHTEKLSAIGQLSASIVHELNNPLQTIFTFLKGLRQQEILKGEERKLLDTVVGESNRIKDLIRNLRDFNRPSPGRRQLTDVHESLDALLLLMRHDLHKRQITVVRSYASDVPQIMAVADQIKQVFLNLLTNATEACQAAGMITISTRQEGGMVAVVIKDTGIGIQPENMEKIFQPFYTTKADTKGTGLGLSISYDIIKKHQGDIFIESQPGEGTTFAVLLPVQGSDL